MNNVLLGLYAVLLAVLSIFTGEIVTFIMLGFILIALVNISRSLKQLIEIQKEKIQITKDSE
ncbi:hypothetical protein [Oceanobacillus jeddahense]|uniref:DUF4229 domain-containing protein n=1 Tax=Oceanobacillus jeddahense TaxID=1462527 RepID=A0ABY5K017_9BACI|nr:hypothetical protein [Oceanobacillus jeddahense]UUI04646.1 hypothetical protein NP439_08335 [Oceanobacillus jeddahense]